MLQTGRPQQEHVRYFVNALSCSSASQLVTIAGFTQAIFSQIAASIQLESDARDAWHSKALRAKCARNAESVLRKLSECARVPAVAFMVELRLSRPVRLWFGMQRHDWPGTRLTLRVRGPFPPIWCSQSMGPHPTGQGSNGDVQNDASTQESCPDQTAVLLR